MTIFLPMLSKASAMAAMTRTRIVRPIAFMYRVFRMMCACVLVSLLALLSVSYCVCVTLPYVGTIAAIDGLCVLVEILGFDCVLSVVVSRSLECPSLRVIESYECVHV